MGEINGTSNFAFILTPRSGGGRGTQKKMFPSVLRWLTGSPTSPMSSMEDWECVEHIEDTMSARFTKMGRLHFRFSRLFLPSTDRCQHACIHRNLFLNIIIKQMLNHPATTDDIDKDMAHDRVPRRITVPRRVPGTLTMSPSWYVAPHNFYGPYKYDRRHDIHMQNHGQNNSWTVRSQSGLSQVSVRSTVRSQSGLVKTKHFLHYNN